MKNMRFAFFIGALCILGVSWYVISMEKVFPSEVLLAQKEKFIRTKHAELEQAQQELARLQKERLETWGKIDDLFQKLEQAQQEKSNLEGVLEMEGLSEREQRDTDREMLKVNFNISLFTDQLKELASENELKQREALINKIEKQEQDIAKLEASIEVEISLLPEAIQERFRLKEEPQPPEPEPVIPQQVVAEEAPPAPEQPESFKLTRGQKVGVGIAAALTVATLTAAVKTYLGWRAYTKKKKALIKKYKLAKFTPLQNKVWMATALASYGIPWYLRYIINNNIGILSDFIGADPRALAELFYDYEPTEDQVKEFLITYFGGVQ